MDADLIGAMEARLLAIERRCVRLEDDTRTLARGVGLSRQGVYESWADWKPRAGTVAAAAGNTLVFGAIRNCNATADTAGSLDISIGGSSVWTGSVDSAGNFAASFALAANATATFTFTPSSTRYDTLTFTWPVVAHASTTVTTVQQLVPASGFHCWAKCPIPLADTLHVTDSLTGTFTATWAANAWSVNTLGSNAATLAGPSGTFLYSGNVKGETTASRVCPPSSLTLVFFETAPSTRTWTWHE